MKLLNTPHCFEVEGEVLYVKVREFVLTIYKKRLGRIRFLGKRGIILVRRGSVRQIPYMWKNGRRFPCDQIEVLDSEGKALLSLPHYFILEMYDENRVLFWSRAPSAD